MTPNFWKQGKFSLTNKRYNDHIEVFLFDSGISLFYCIQIIIMKLSI